MNQPCLLRVAVNNLVGKLRRCLRGVAVLHLEVDMVNEDQRSASNLLAARRVWSVVPQYCPKRYYRRTPSYGFYGNGHVDVDQSGPPVFHLQERWTRTQTAVMYEYVDYPAVADHHTLFGKQGSRYHSRVPSADKHSLVLFFVQR